MLSRLVAESQGHMPFAFWQVDRARSVAASEEESDPELARPGEVELVRRDLAELRRGDGGVGPAVIARVERVEHLEAELDHLVAREPRVLEHGDGRVLDRGIADVLE